MLAEEEIAVVEGGGVEGDEQVVWAGRRSWDVAHLKTIDVRKLYILFVKVLESLRVIHLPRLPFDLLHRDGFWHDCGSWAVFTEGRLMVSMAIEKRLRG